MKNNNVVNKVTPEIYSEIIKLHHLLEQSGIPHEFVEDKDKDDYEVIVHPCPQMQRLTVEAYQGAKVLGTKYYIKMFGAMTNVEMREKGKHLTHLRAEEVYKRFVYCVKNKTCLYQDDDKFFDYKQTQGKLIYFYNETDCSVDSKESHKVIVSKHGRVYMKKTLKFLGNYMFNKEGK